MIRHYGKKIISYALAAAMVLSGLVFCAKPQVAEAASAGSYKLTITINVTNKADKTGSIQGATYKIYYCPTNGTGSETSMPYDMTNNLLSTGEKNVDITVPGFPTKVYCYNDAVWTDKVDYNVTKIAVQGTAGWTGSQKMNSGGWGNSDVDATLTISLTKPFANTMTASFNTGTVNCPKTSSASAVTNTLTYTATDQYGVTMASSLCNVSVASNQASNQVNGSNAVSITNNHTGTDTVSAPYAANVKGATNSQTITATCSWKGSSTQEKEATFTLYDAMYLPTFKYYTTNEAGTTGTENTVTGTSTYFGVVPTVPTAASTVTAYHTSTTHYTDGKYSNLPDSATGIRADSTYTMSYTSGAHNKVLVNTEPTDGVEGKNYYECDGCDIKFVCDAEGNPGDVASESDIASATVPAPSFNTFSGVGYDYSARGVALRCLKADLAQQTSQATRFTASLQIPAGAQVDDFGYVYTQTRFLNGSVEPENDDNTAYGIENFTLDNVGTQYNIYQQSVMQNGTEGNGYTTHTSGANTVYTFNLLINVRNANWTKHYAARAYIKYTYNGRQYTVYDKSYSSRTVYYVAQKICDASNTSEKEQTKKSVNNKVLNFVNPDAYPLV